MVNTRGVGRLAILAVGLGIGAAVASTPGIASADTPADPFSWIAGLDSGDLSAAALPAASPLDVQISIDGFDLFPTADNGAHATSGMGDIAIAFGADSDASATGGFGDYALADSTGSDGASAIAGDPLPDATGNNFDFASATGNNVDAAAGNDATFTPDTTGSSFDSASASGNNTGFGFTDAFAGDNGSGDVASAVGPNVESFSGRSLDADAPANFDSASAIGNNTTPTTDTTEAIAGGGPFADVGGSSDTAFVVDPLGTLGSTATAGLGNNFDLAGVFGDDLNATATGANFLVDILPSL
jgi:hypothetical protein